MVVRYNPFIQMSANARLQTPVGVPIAGSAPLQPMEQVEMREAWRSFVQQEAFIAHSGALRASHCYARSSYPLLVANIGSQVP